ncbi:PRC-barrel protein [Desulfocurvibacter africanus PCS]|uniref:PRC-barrel protein n=1 Tax=Desulfocurvibacter africanus PCS TaxID=1262666 RepID=M5Q1A4_DESAF|nr:PRC-barrel domain-containing protein [Desulfocurvibacter africanus]EMG36383.1 PRC-barrel protein [Desulfocurvibacter africanus PCS]
MRAVFLFISAVMLLAYAGVPLAAQGQQTELLPELLVQGQAVLNRAVNIPSKDRTGEIVDLMVDPATGHIGFALLSFSGFMGLVEKNVIAPIPWARVEFEPKQKTFVARGIGSGEGGDIVEYDEDKWQVFDETELASLYESYALRNQAQESREAYSEVAGTDKVARERLSMLQLTRLINAPVMSRKGALLGYVDKLYLDLTGGFIRLVDVRSPGDRLEQPAHLVPYPLLDYDWGEGRFTLDVSRKDQARLEDFPVHAGMYVQAQTMRQIYRNMGLAEYLRVGG